MRNVAILPIEGVLAAGGDLKSGQPQDWARPFYESLKLNYRIILLTDETEELARIWLANNFLGDFANVLSANSSWKNWAEWKADMVRQFLADDFQLSLMVDTDPETLAKVNDMGVMTMLLSPPTRRRGWKNHMEEARPWGDIVATLAPKER